MLSGELYHARTKHGPLDSDRRFIEPNPARKQQVDGSDERGRLAEIRLHPPRQEHHGESIREHGQERPDGGLRQRKLLFAPPEDELN